MRGWATPKLAHLHPSTGYVDQYDGKVAHTYVDDFGIEQRATLDTGLSVTLFERTADGHRVVAVRGSEISDLRDLRK